MWLHLVRALPEAAPAGPNWQCNLTLDRVLIGRTHRMTYTTAGGPQKSTPDSQMRGAQFDIFAEGCPKARPGRIDSPRVARPAAEFQKCTRRILARRGGIRPELAGRVASAAANGCSMTRADPRTRDAASPLPGAARLSGFGIGRFNTAALNVGIANG